MLDNYSIHQARGVIRYLALIDHRIVLHFLPPYSPDDNVIERLWKQMNNHVTRNYRHSRIESLIEDVRRFLNDGQPFPGTKVSTLRVT